MFSVKLSKVKTIVREKEGGTSSIRSTLCRSRQKRMSLKEIGQQIRPDSGSGRKNSRQLEKEVGIGNGNDDDGHDDDDATAH